MVRSGRFSPCDPTNTPGANCYQHWPIAAIWPVHLVGLRCPQLWLDDFLKQMPVKNYRGLRFCSTCSSRNRSANLNGIFWVLRSGRRGGSAGHFWSVHYLLQSLRSLAAGRRSDIGWRSTCRQPRSKFPSQSPKMVRTSFQVAHRSPNRRSLQTPTVNCCNGKRARPTMLRQDMRYADVATHIRPRSATVPMHKLALTAPKRQSARPIPLRQPYSTAGPCPSGCEALVRGRPVLRSEWIGMESGRTHGRSGNSVDVSSPGASLSRGAPGRLRQSHRSNDRGEFTCLDRSN